MSNGFLAGVPKRTVTVAETVTSVFLNVIVGTGSGGERGKGRLHGC